MTLMTRRLSVQHCRLERPAMQICRLCALLHQVAGGVTLPITCVHEHGHGWVACAPYDDLQQLLIYITAQECVWPSCPEVRQWVPQAGAYRICLIIEDHCDDLGDMPVSSDECHGASQAS